MFLSPPQLSSTSCRRFDASLLSRTRDWRGRIAARHPSSVVCVPEDPAEPWLSLLQAERELGPCSLILDDLDLSPGLRLRLHGRRLVFADGRIVGLQGSGRALQVVSDGSVSSVSLAAQLRLPAWPRLQDEGFLERALAEALRALLAATPGALRRLVGLGEGSTPSGDDMLVGVLAGLRRLASGSSRLGDMEEAVLALPEEATTPLGIQMLRQAARGRFVEPLARLASRLGGDVAAEELEEDIRRLRAVGARSGADMLVGLHRLAQGECGWT